MRGGAIIQWEKMAHKRGGLAQILFSEVSDFPKGLVEADGTTKAVTRGK